MPAVSQRQFRAMEAAAAGKSTLGIPAKVGKEFAAATPDPKALPARKPRGIRAMPSPHPGEDQLPKMHSSKHH